MKPTDQHIFDDLSALIREHPLLRLAAGEAGPGRVFLVGGLIRDLLAGRGAAGRKDADLAVSRGVLSLGRTLARLGKARMVLLSEKDKTVRLVGPVLEVDLTQFRASSLEEDLRARDFTINALALDLHLAERGEIRLIDPCQGRADLEQGILRAANPDAMTQDPLRILRAYRLGAELGLTLAGGTRTLIRRAVRDLDRIAGERINAELTRLLQTPDSATWLRLMEDGRSPGGGLSGSSRSGGGSPEPVPQSQRSGAHPGGGQAGGTCPGPR